MNSLLKQKQEQMRQQEIKAFVTSTVNESAKKALEGAERKINVNTNTIVLSALHEVFGWGHERLMRFYTECAKYQKYMALRYDDDSAIVAMKRNLREECMIDVDALVDEAYNDKERGKTEIEI